MGSGTLTRNPSGVDLTRELFDKCPSDQVDVGIEHLAMSLNEHQWDIWQTAFLDRENFQSVTADIVPQREMRQDCNSQARTGGFPSGPKVTDRHAFFGSGKMALFETVVHQIGKPIAFNSMDKWNRQ